MLLFALLFPPLYVLFVPEQRGADLALPLPPTGTYRVFVADLGYHTAIIVEQPRGLRLGPPGEEAAPFLEYAWGDRRFYLQSDFRPHALFATLVLPTESVLYIDGRDAPPHAGTMRNILERTVDAMTLHRLLTELERSARRNRSGARQSPFAPAPGYRGRFYPAHGAYLWTRDCNWWTVARLAEAGLAGAPAAVFITRQVPGRLRGFTRVTSSAAPAVALPRVP